MGMERKQKRMAHFFRASSKMESNMAREPTSITKPKFSILNRMISVGFSNANN